MNCIRTLSILSLLAACGTTTVYDDLRPDDPSWEEFRAQAHLEDFDGGVYIVDGDSPIPSEKLLRELYDRRFGGDERTLIVHQVAGVDAKWSAVEALDLTYCISDEMGPFRPQVVDAMYAAAAEWEEVANVRFVHLSEEDTDCNRANDRVVFDVNIVSGQPYLARAFFPNQGRESRNLLIDTTAFVPMGTMTLAGIMRHELGHALGFRHEHTRPESSMCHEDDNWRALTDYDRESVMHYPFCAGSDDFSLRLTELDKAGAASLYGAPGSHDPETPSLGSSHRGFVLPFDERAMGPYSVTPGSSVRVAMTGWGDADLYVHFGAPPTDSEFSCRPFESTSKESCALDVPTGETEMFIMVQGYETAAFDLEVAWDGDVYTGETVDDQTRIVDLANYLTESTLHDDLAIDQRAIDSIIDERPFASFGDLDAAYYVGPVTLSAIHSYDGSLSEAETNILFAANTASFVALDVHMRLDARAARGIIDDRPFSLVADVDAVSYVNDAALSRMEAWGRDHTATDDVVILRVANTATLLELDYDVPLDARAAQGIVSARPFTSLEALDAVPYVGPTAMDRMLSWGRR